jgi:hypothetical protein
LGRRKDAPSPWGGIWDGPLPGVTASPQAQIACRPHACRECDTGMSNRYRRRRVNLISTAPASRSPPPGRPRRTSALTWVLLSGLLKPSVSWSYSTSQPRSGLATSSSANFGTGQSYRANGRELGTRGHSPLMILRSPNQATRMTWRAPPPKSFRQKEWQDGGGQRSTQARRAPWGLPSPQSLRRPRER